MDRELDDLLQATWLTLDDATRRRTPSTLGFLATVDATGAPHARAVILRRVDAALACLYFATDARSAKAAELARDPRAAFAVYDDDASVQLRLEGRAAVVSDERERRGAWESLGPHSRRLYGSPIAPRTPLPADAEGAEQEGAPATDEDAFARFAWLRLRVDRIDRLDLSAEPQRRWVLVRAEAGWTGARVEP